ncbi:MAG: arsenite methyltransferase [Euryarchaeota archaeon]|nr:arsenite methyltransferase [Euryarchaeota archaeon]
MDEAKVKKMVRDGYAKVAVSGGCGCGCGPQCTSSAISKELGYSEKDIGEVPEGANLGLGCGNPIALASLKKGEVVMDLGSGGGFDCFLAASRVGKNGKVIGVDMTPEMLDRSRMNAKKGGYRNVEFRLGEIENLPAADNSVDVIISNCVINLAPDKLRVFSEAFRVLKPGGRLMVSDIVITRPLPEKVMGSVRAYVGCLSGAIMKDDYLKMIRSAGFRSPRVVGETQYPVSYMKNDESAKAIGKEAGLTEKELERLGASILSIRVSAVKG